MSFVFKVWFCVLSFKFVPFSEFGNLILFFMNPTALLLLSFLASHSCAEENSAELFESQKHSGTEKHKALRNFVYSVSLWFKTDS